MKKFLGGIGKFRITVTPKDPNSEEEAVLHISSNDFKLNEVITVVAFQKRDVFGKLNTKLDYMLKDWTLDFSSMFVINDALAMQDAFNKFFTGRYDVYFTPRIDARQTYKVAFKADAAVELGVHAGGEYSAGNKDTVFSLTVIDPITSLDWVNTNDFTQLFTPTGARIDNVI